MICSLSIELTYLIPRRSGLRGETLGNCKSETGLDDRFDANRLNGCMPCHTRRHDPVIEWPYANFHSHSTFHFSCQGAALAPAFT